MRIVLINMASKPNVANKATNGMYPYSLLFVSSYVRKFGFDAKILDLSTTINWHEELHPYLENNKFDVIGFTSTTENRFMVCDAIRATKSIQPDAIIVVGGNHFTFTAEHTLNHIPEIDFVVRGEGEVIFLELINCLDTKDTWPNIKGISYREDGKIIHNPPREPERDIEQFTITEDALRNVVLHKGNYSPFIYLRNWQERNIKALPINIGRGCPAKCVYCIHNKKRYRTREVDSVISEIKHKQKKFSCSVFHLDDAYLLKRKEFVKDLCNRIMEENLNIQWYAETRMDIDPSFLDLMRRAGCISLDFGLESASPKVLKAIKKGINIEQAEEALKKSYALGIRAGVFAMISLPDEEEENALSTIEFLRKNQKYIKTFIYTPTIIYPGTELEIMAKERGILPESFNWYDKDYINEVPDLIVSCTPVYIENLSPGFIRYCMKEVGKLQSLNLQIVPLFKRELPSFLFDWKSQHAKDKFNKLRKTCEIINNKYFSRIK